MPGSAEVVVNLVEFVLQCFLTSDVLAMHPFNQLTRGLLSPLTRPNSAMSEPNPDQKA